MVWTDNALFAERPFGLPADSREIILDIPLPPSVNRTRKVNWPGHKAYKAWKKHAGWHLVDNGQLRAAGRYMQRYELTITLDEAKCQLDPDNTVKAISDLLRELHIITDDGPKFARRIIIQWGCAPDGCRVMLRTIHGPAE